MPSRCVHLPDALAVRFDKAAAAEGGRSLVLRRLVEGYLASQGVDVGDDAIDASLPRGRGVRVTLRLKAEELAAVETASRERGVRRTVWLTALIRARLLRRPTLNGEEMDAYWRAQRELNRIGVNLNQVARAVNVAVLDGSVLKAEQHTINAAVSEIREIAKDIRAAFKGNVAYWDAGA